MFVDTFQLQSQEWIFYIDVVTTVREAYGNGYGHKLLHVASAVWILVDYKWFKSRYV